MRLHDWEGKVDPTSDENFAAFRATCDAYRAGCLAMYGDPSVKANRFGPGDSEIRYRAEVDIMVIQCQAMASILMAKGIMQPAEWTSCLYESAKLAVARLEKLYEEQTGRKCRVTREGIELL